MKRIVIIGGMGPQASLELHSRILQAASRNGAKNGSEFPFIVHVSLPIDDFIAQQGKTKQALKMIVKEMKQIGLRGDDSVIVACNTAHLLKEDIEHQLGINLLSLIEATTDHILSSGIKKVELLASPTSVSTGLYTKPLLRAGIEVIEPNKNQVMQLEQMIRSVIAGVPMKPTSTTGTVKLLGCTELSCMFAGKPNVIDPLDIIVNTLVKEGRMI
jgi:aspartate racemase